MPFDDSLPKVKMETATSASVVNEENGQQNAAAIAPVTFNLASDDAQMEIDPPLINQEVYDAEKEKNKRRYKYWRITK